MSEWKLVPVEPTDAMCAAAIGASLKDPESINGLPQYRAMIAAAPIPEQVAQATILATWPERIWLQYGESEPETYPGAGSEITWCEDNINGAGDVEYVRADLATQSAKQGAQPLIGKLLDQFSALPVLWGLNEPGALLRHSDVFAILVKAGKEAAGKASVEQAPVAQEVTQQAAKAEIAEFNEEHMAHLINRLSVANRREGWRGTPEYNNADRESAKQEVDSAERKLLEYVRSLAPTTSTVSATAEESRKEADWARAVAFASANQNASTASASGQWKSLVDKAVDVLQRHIVPDGLSDSDAINLMYSIFDGAEYRAAQAATDKSED